jgi:acetyl/propionyl-CoA carboxylase alpha subunit
MRYIATIEGREYPVEILDEQHVAVAGVIYQVDFQSLEGQPVHSLIVDGRSFEGHVYPAEDLWQVLLHGGLYPVKVEDEREKRLRMALGNRVLTQDEYHLRSPMPGLIVAVPVSEGQTVAKGQVLVVLESMKMQNELRAPRAGTVSRVRIRAGDSVEQKAMLLSVV